MGFGFVVARFGLFLREVAHLGRISSVVHPGLARASNFTGTILMTLGVIVLVLAIWSHQQQVARLERGELRIPPRWSLAAVLGVIIVVLGLYMAIYLTLAEL
jgi:putative membrane protein